MKKLLLISILALLTGCVSKGKNEAYEAPDDGFVYLYYFNTETNKCPSCVSVEQLAKRIAEERFEKADSVRFVWVNTSLKENQPLVKKYSIHINGIVVARGEDSENLNRVVFSNIANNPSTAADKIESEIRKRLTTK